MPLTFAETPLYYKDSQGQYQRILSGADMTGYARIDEESHRNLLDNWYFVGGGSQLGNGVFPINQRGQTTYSNAGNYSIDRWGTWDFGSPVITLGQKYLTITNNSANTRAVLAQALPTSLPDGEQITVSILFNNNVLLHGTSVVPTTSTSDVFSDPVIEFGINSIVRLRTMSSGRKDVQIVVGSQETHNIIAVKLELGSYQTLAHQENGTWVLNEIPDYNEQLQACQRYYIKFDRYIASGFLTNSGKEYNMPIYLPITMAGTPTATMSGYVARTPNGYSAHTGGNWTAPTNLGVYYPNNGFVLLADTINSAVDTNNTQINYYIKDLVLTV